MSGSKLIMLMHKHLTQHSTVLMAIPGPLSSFLTLAFSCYLLPRLYLLFHLLYRCQYAIQNRALLCSNSRTHFHFPMTIQFHFIGIQSYAKTNSWINGTNCCTWNGVTCDNKIGISWASTLVAVNFKVPSIPQQPFLSSTSPETQPFLQ